VIRILDVPDCEIVKVPYQVSPRLNKILSPAAKENPLTLFSVAQEVVVDVPFDASFPAELI
jgi:hypothetical protein